VVQSTFPVALKLDGRRVVVAGGGDEAAARARALSDSGARVVAFAPAAGAPVRALAEAGVIELVARRVEPADLDGTWLVVLAERDPPYADELATLTEARQIFYVAVDDSRVGSFSHLAIARAGLVFAAIGSQGEAPALARRLRELFEVLFQRAGLEAFAERLAALRRETPVEKRRAALDAAVAGLTLDGKLVVPAEGSLEGRRTGGDGQ